MAQLWEKHDAGHGREMPPSTHRLVKRAREVAARLPQDERRPLFTLVDEIEALFARDGWGKAEEEQLGKLEDRLLDALSR